MTNTKRTWSGGIGILEVEDTGCTTSGAGMTIRYRSAPLDSAQPTTDEDLMRDAEEWAFDVLKRAGIAADGVVNGTADTQENYAQRFIYYSKSIRDKKKRGDSAGAVADALLLGGFIRESQLKFKWETHVEKYDRVKVEARKKGSLGAKVRWTGEDRDNLSDIVERLATSRDNLGDYISPADLWTEFLGQLDLKGADPVEKSGNTLMKAYVIYGNRRDSHTYEAFRKQIGRLRNGGT